MVRSLSNLVSDARPTAFHQMLATLAREGRLMRLYTQNVDGIDTSLPPLMTSIPLSMRGPWPRTIQLHGGLEKMVCSKCNHLSDFKAALFDGPSPPPCTACIEMDKVRTDHAGKRSHGIGRLRPRIVLYNEHNPDEEAIGTVVNADLRTRPDALIVVGTSMKIPGVRRIVREMCGVIRNRKGGLTVWINHEPPPIGKEFEDCWDLVVKGACDEVALRANMRRWDDDGVDVKSCTESEVERAKKRAGEVNVLIQSTAKKQLDPALPTPASSPRSKSTKPPPIKLRFKVAKPSKVAAKKPSHPTTLKLTAHKSGSKPKGTKKQPADSSSAPKSSKITTAFRVTKTTKPPAKNPNPTFSSGGDELHIPMAPISPQAARNNGPVQTRAKVLFPNLMKVKSVGGVMDGEEEGKRSVELNRKSDDIVSPTGAIPSGMKKLLN